MHVNVIEFDSALALAHSWCLRPEGRMVCAANVHMVMEAWDDSSFRAQVNRADLVLPDGQPMVWALRLLGQLQRRRVRVSSRSHPSPARSLGCMAGGNKP
jgi:N-acetylglucosaminyldiphosphoundecaprenol N-acetyl-beta-D-mannosaminyltransferase